jgi:hypothetical protein
MGFKVPWLYIGCGRHASAPSSCCYLEYVQGRHMGICAVGGMHLHPMRVCLSVCSNKKMGTGV